MRSTALLLLLAAPAAFGQGRTDFLGIQKFRGTVTYNTSFSGRTDMGADVKMVATATATFVMERAGGTTPTWQGRFVSSSSSVSLDAKSGYGNCTVSESFSIQGPLLPGDSGPYDTRLRMFADSWNFNLSGYRGPKQISKVTITCSNPPSVTIREVEADLYLPPWLYDLPYPGSGTRLQHTGTVENDGDFSGYLDHHLSSIQWNYSISIEPDAGDLKLEITSDKYKDWLPSATASGEPGDALELKARLIRTPSGEEAPQDVRSFEWELVDTSQEPGVALNWPRDAKDDNFDMRFRPQGDQVAETDKKQKIKRLVRNTATDTAILEPVDWGGWATMRVTVELLDGRRIVGEFKDTGDKDIRLPKRKQGSLIADKFLEDKKASGADNSDDENDPEGDGSKGDGLTLYEEYRGFYVNEAHVYGEPKKKEYFAVNENKMAAVEQGLAQFGSVTGLTVHSKLKPEELSADRVINANRKSGPQRVRQHGVLYRDAGYVGFAQANGGPGTPKSITFVGLPSQLPARPTATPGLSYFAVTVAHEALHTVNVWHHGETDLTLKWTARNGVVTEEQFDVLKELVGTSSISIFDENDNNLTARFARRLEGRVEDRELGSKHGQHSGVEDCLMRYDIANTYVHKDRADGRYIIRGSETVGTALCGQATGTGVNQPERSTPQPRYFDAAGSRGNCRVQVVVNDAAPAPKR